MTSTLAVLHIAKKNLGFDEDTYRAQLAEITGKFCAKAVTEAAPLKNSDDLPVSQCFLELKAVLNDNNAVVIYYPGDLVLCGGELRRKTFFSSRCKPKELVTDILEFCAVLDNFGHQQVPSLLPFLIGECRIKSSNKRDGIVVFNGHRPRAFRPEPGEIVTSQAAAKGFCGRGVLQNMISGSEERTPVTKNSCLNDLIVSLLCCLINCFHYTYCPPCGKNGQPSSNKCLEIEEDITPSIAAILAIDRSGFSKQHRRYDGGGDQEQNQVTISRLLGRQSYVSIERCNYCFFNSVDVILQTEVA